MRIDVPTLKCDRCGVVTNLPFEMGKFKKLITYDVGGEKTWDLCPDCWTKFTVFVSSAG